MTRATCRAILIVGIIGLFAQLPGSAVAENDELRTLAKERVDVATKGFETAETGSKMLLWADRILKSELALGESADHRISALENHVRRTEKIEKTVIAGQKQGAYTAEEL